MLFLAGLICGAIISVIMIKYKPNNKCDAVMLDPKPSNEDISSYESEKEETLINIPIEIFPNLYSLECENISIKHHKTYKNGKINLNYITLKCVVRYALNGRKEGKRRFIFTSYDANGHIIESRGEYDAYRLTEAGCEILEACFNNCDKNFPHKISLLIREVADGR